MGKGDMYRNIVACWQFCSSLVVQYYVEVKFYHFYVQHHIIIAYSSV